MKNKSNRKPTILEVKEVINGILTELNNMQSAIMQLDSIIYGYIDFKKDNEKYRDYIVNKVKDKNGEGKPNGSSPEDNKRTDKGTKGK
tara:strand:+ start:128 stop:391 length:264 start_codon:yes stop_codon:yes gene_type:complete